MPVSMPDYETDDIRPDPELQSAPCTNYLLDAGKLISYSKFVLDAAEGIDRHIAGVAQPSTDEPVDPEYAATVLTKGGGFIKAYFQFEELQTAMILCRSVDNFLIYLAEILALVFRTNPETLKSGETVRLDFLLQFQSFSELVNAIVDKRVNDLSYSGMEDLSTYLSERLGFDLFPARENLKRARYLIEVRNLIVHSRGIINTRFLRKLKDLEGDFGNLGSQVPIGHRLALVGLLFLRECVCDIDERAAQKFHLPRRQTVKTG